MEKRFQTATLSHDELRSILWQKLDKDYWNPDAKVSSWPSLVDVYDGFFLAKLTMGGKYGLYKVPYTIDGEDDVVIGTPVALLASKAKVVKGSIDLAATADLITGEDADTFLANLKKDNPLFASLAGWSPNTHLVVFDLTTLGKPSQHAGPMRYELEKSGLEAAISTLVSKPIHVTAGLDGHFVRGQAAKPIGAILGAEGIDNADGTTTVRAIGTLWSKDFPEEVAQIQAQKPFLGASYEIEYLAASATRAEKDLTRIGAYAFSGAAILRRDAAAHPETSLLVADKTKSGIDPSTGQPYLLRAEAGTYDVLDEEGYDDLARWFEGTVQADKLTYEQRQDLKDSDFALIQTDGDKKIRRFPIQDEAHRKNAWARLPQAKNLSDAERAEVANKIISRAKSAGDDWAKNYKKSNGKWTNDASGGRTMTMSTKYPGGLPAEYDTIVAGLISSALDRAFAAMDPGEPDSDDMDMSGPSKKKKSAVRAQLAELTTLKTQVAELEPAKAALAVANEKIAVLEPALTAANGKLAEVEPKMAELQAAIAAAARKEAIEAQWAKVQAKYGFAEKDIASIKAAKMPLLEKLADGKGLGLEEMEELAAGSTKTAASADPVKPELTVPLMAGSAADGAVPTGEQRDKILAAWPVVAAVVNRKGCFN
jgi:hypothetical protein